MTRSLHSHHLFEALLARRADAPRRYDAFSGAMSQPRPAGPSRRIMTEAEATSLARYVCDVLDQPGLNVEVKHVATVVSTQHPDALPQCTDVDVLTVEWSIIIGHIRRVSLAISTDVRDAETLRRVIEKAVPRPPEPPKTPLSPEDSAAQMRGESIYAPRVYTYLPVILWHDSTATAMETQRGEMLARLCAPLVGTPWHGYATVAATQEAHLVLDGKDGVRHAWGEATDSEISLTVRDPEGTTAGWSGQARRDWRELEPERVAQEAMRRAEQHRGAERVEPGRYTAILSATAVGQLLHSMAPYYNVDWDGPFNLPGQKMVGDKDRKGERVFDPRITIRTNPADPDGGDYPFYWGRTPYPSGAVTWVEHGVLQRRSSGITRALELGLTPFRDPYCVRMSGGPTSVEEMISRCDRGLYVHRFSSVRRGGSQAGMMEGFTGGGCLFIMNGKITRPVKDFRFSESPFLVMNRVLALGASERVAFGFGRTFENGWEQENRWPYPPVIAPPIMVLDFNFVALSDAV